MSGDQWFALATIIVTNGFTAMVAILSNKAAASREGQAFSRQVHKERIETARALYAEFIATLNYRPFFEDWNFENQKQTHILAAKMILIAPPNLQRPIQQTVEILERANKEMLRLSSGAEYDDRAYEQIYSEYRAHLSNLSALLAEHMTYLDRKLQPASTL
jgi:hypothetical protein